MPHQGRSAQVYLEGLVAHKDIAIQGEAQLAALEKHGVCLRQLTVCMQQAAVMGSLLSLFVIQIFAQAVPYIQVGATLRQRSLCLWRCKDTIALESAGHIVSTAGLLRAYHVHMPAMRRTHRREILILRALTGIRPGPAVVQALAKAFSFHVLGAV